MSFITDSAVPAYLLFLVNGTDAETSYAGSLDFKVVVERTRLHQQTSSPGLSRSSRARGTSIDGDLSGEDLDNRVLDLCSQGFKRKNCGKDL